MGRQAGRRVPGERHRHGPFLPPGAGAFVPGRYWRGCVGYRSGSWTGLGLDLWDFWDLGRERGDSRASGEFRVSPVSQPILPAWVCVCGVRPWQPGQPAMPACQSCQPQFEPHLMAWALSPAFPCGRSPFGSETWLWAAGIGRPPVKLQSSWRQYHAMSTAKLSFPTVCAAQAGPLPDCPRQEPPS